MNTKIKKITILSLFAALSIGIYALEMLIPNPFPIPGIKLGLANIIALVVLKKYGFREASLTLLVRILLSTLLFGQFMSLLYSAVGGILCLVSAWLINKLLKGHAIFITSIIGALFHNLGQIIVAIIITRSIAILSYAPYLIIAAILTGLFTGLCAHFSLKLIPRSIK